MSGVRSTTTATSRIVGVVADRSTRRKARDERLNRTVAIKRVRIQKSLTQKSTRISSEWLRGRHARADQNRIPTLAMAAFSHAKV